MALRYQQFCPLARAAEVIGERWTLLVIRELLLGPKRFSDLRQALDSLSTSVLAARLNHLLDAGLVERHLLPPPAASWVYELTPDGRALEETILALIRWGVRLLLPRRPNERLDPQWIRLVLSASARKGKTPSRSFNLRIETGAGLVELHLRGGAKGTLVSPAGDPADVTITTDAEALLAMMSGLLAPQEALTAGRIQAAGDLACLPLFPQLFELDWSPEETTLRPANRTGDLRGSSRGTSVS